MVCYYNYYKNNNKNNCNKNKFTTPIRKCTVNSAVSMTSGNCCYYGMTRSSRKCNQPTCNTMYYISGYTNSGKCCPNGVTINKKFCNKATLTGGGRYTCIPHPAVAKANIFPKDLNLPDGKCCRYGVTANRVNCNNCVTEFAYSINKDGCAGPETYTVQGSCSYSVDGRVCTTQHGTRPCSTDKAYGYNEGYRGHAGSPRTQPITNNYCNNL